jgi:hypothetical protein
MIELVDFWKNCDLSQAPYIHDADRPYIDAATNVSKVILRSHREFVAHSTFGDENDSSLHLGLLPVPFQGNLSKADIFIIMLNRVSASAITRLRKMRSTPSRSV